MDGGRTSAKRGWKGARREKWSKGRGGGRPKWVQMVKKGNFYRFVKTGGRKGALQTPLHPPLRADMHDDVGAHAQHVGCERNGALRA